MQRPERGTHTATLQLRAEQILQVADHLEFDVDKLHVKKKYRQPARRVSRYISQVYAR
jgi:hypothetical protein